MLQVCDTNTVEFFWQTKISSLRCTYTSKSTQETWNYPYSGTGKGCQSFFLQFCNIIIRLYRHSLECFPLLIDAVHLIREIAHVHTLLDWIPTICYKTSSWWLQSTFNLPKLEPPDCSNSKHGEASFLPNGSLIEMVVVPIFEHLVQ